MYVAADYVESIENLVRRRQNQSQSDWTLPYWIGAVRSTPSKRDEYLSALHYVGCSFISFLAFIHLIWLFNSFPSFTPNSVFYLMSFLFDFTFIIFPFPLFVLTL